jgi:iron complex outermembrane receptor protein
VVAADFLKGHKLKLFGLADMMQRQGRFKTGAAAATVWTVAVLVCAWMLLAPAMVRAAETEPANSGDSTDFTEFSLEELKDVVIVSASKKPEMVSDTAAAVYVITQEDIRRSGVTSIPEALRLAPGVHVARITATDWAINIRGLNSQFAQNLLVLIDGRSVYTHVFSGVFWDVQDTVLEDIERIEVIRGPGAAIWGANAVNGVINIITKKASQTQGGQAIILGGSQEQSASVRYGGTLDNQAYYRVYGKFFNRGDLSDVTTNLDSQANDPNDASSSDNWRSGRGGFRVDMMPGHGLAESSSNAFTLQGEAYRNRYDKEFERRSIIFPSAVQQQTDEDSTSEAMGWHLQGTWQHTIASDSATTLQFYHDYTNKDYDPGSGRVNTTDLDFQHHLTLAERHEFVWGLEYKNINDEFDDSSNISMSPSDLSQNLWSIFLQDEIALQPKRWTLILGSKFEHNEFTGLEIQPSIRALYKPDEMFSAWGAISRAVRVPSRLELHGQTTDMVDLPDVNPSAPVEVVTHGNSNLEPESLIAYELGMRLKPRPAIWLDTAIFYNSYDDLIGLELIDSDLANNRYDLGYGNNTSGRSYGLEAALDWKATSNWLLGATYTYLHTLIKENKVQDPTLSALIAKGSNPRHSFAVRSYLDVTDDIDFDLWFRYVGRLPERNIDAYTVLDTRLAWRVSPHVELSLVGQNLLESGHSEFSTLEIKRSIYGKLDWKF